MCGSRWRNGSKKEVLFIVVLLEHNVIIVCKRDKADAVLLPVSLLSPFKGWITTSSNGGILLINTFFVEPFSRNKRWRKHSTAPL